MFAADAFRDLCGAQPENSGMLCTIQGLAELLLFFRINLLRSFDAFRSTRQLGQTFFSIFLFRRADEDGGANCGRRFQLLWRGFRRAEPVRKRRQVLRPARRECRRASSAVYDAA